MKKWVLSWVIFCAVVVAGFAQSDKVVVAYFIQWGIYARGYDVAAIPADTLTHVNYAFAGVASDGSLYSLDAYADVDKGYPGDSWDADALRGNFNQLLLLKAAHPHLRVLLSLGGWGSSEHFSAVAATAAGRNRLALSCADWVERYGFDGIDVDWEYPVSGGDADVEHRPEDAANYVLLLQAIRDELNALTAETGHTYELTIAASAGYDTLNERFDVRAIQEVVDWINIMSYDFNGPWGAPSHPVTGHASALFSNPADGNNPRYTVDDAVQAYLQAGADADQLVVGIPFYAHGYGGVAAGAQGDGLFQSYSGAVQEGSWIWNGTGYGVYEYRDLVDGDCGHNYVNEQGFVRYWDPISCVPYLYNAARQIFISYDDAESIGLKCDYVMANDLRGVMYWSGDADTQDEQLHTLIADKILDGHVNPEPTPAPTPEPTPTAVPPQPTPTPVATVVPNTADFPARVYAPYIDVCAWPTFSAAAMQTRSGVSFFTLAFIVADPSDQPAWGGYAAYGIDSTHYMDEINAVRAAGGDVIVSFGGANGRELAMVSDTVDELVQKYQSVIDRYQLRWVDFDIEGFAVGDTASIDLRNRAIRQLQQDNPALRIAYCLPVLPTGLNFQGLHVLENALERGVRIDLVNIMTMDYGDGAAPNPQNYMGEYTIQAAQGLYSQLQVLFPEKTSAECWAMIGVTPMIGQNDVQSEVFNLEDAQQVAAFAAAQGMGLVSMWSANRDNASCGTSPWASATCSGIEQDEFAFAAILQGYATGQPTPPPTPVPTETPTPVPTMMPTPTVIPQPTPQPTPSESTWSATCVYVSGDLVEHAGQLWLAHWWTRGEEPGTTGIWGVWRLASHVNPTPVPTATPVPTLIPGGSTWDAATVYVNGDQVVHNGQLWNAHWWTRGEEPGTTGDWGVWRP